MDDSLLILGASVRAAAQSAARAGWRPICGDLFLDADLPDTAVGQVARSFPRDLVRIAEGSPPAPWMYTGGLENYPRLVDRISRGRELLGTSAEALRRVRDPFEVARVLGRHGLLFPECRTTNDGLPADGTWLRKHRRSSGGLRVALWRGQRDCGNNRGWYFQRRIDGLSMSAVYLAANENAQLLGATEQLLSGGDSSPFRYVGSIGPIELPAYQREALMAIGEALSREFRIRGLFGVDLVMDGSDFWTIEVNPRWTASIEILERTLGFNAMAFHVAACRNDHLPDLTHEAPRRVCGKRIVYANRSGVVTSHLLKAITDRNRGHDWPLVADIPRAGIQLQPAQPVLTVFDEAETQHAARERLLGLHNELQSELATAIGATETH